jgi:uncharacterized protein
MYDTTLPFMLHGLKTLDAILTKAEAHCEARKIKPEALLTFRLYPDMLPFLNQVYLVTDFAKGCAARLSGQTVPSFPDDEKTFTELHARIAKCIAFVSSVDSKSLDGADARSVTIRVGRDKEATMTGKDYFNGFALPNFYFHMTTAYNILRHNGVELGKGDFMGRTP